MDSMISLGQKNTLAEYMILSGADNHPPMLDKDLYNSWKSRMELYMKNREHRRMILESSCQGFLGDSSITDASLAISVFSPGDDLIACLNKAMAVLTIVASSRGEKVKVILVLVIRVMLLVLGETMQADRQGLLNVITVKDKAMLAKAQEAGQTLDEEQLSFLADPGVPDGQAVQTIILNNAAFQTEDLDTYDSDYDDISNAKAVLMANISNYGSDVISEVPHSETYLNDMENQSMHAMQDFEQTPAVDFTDSEIHSDSNIIPYSQYLQETQQANVQDTHLQAQQDSMI
ncbi:hypothetical protein Tco_1021264 [Tanacetum coccineum]